MDDWNYEDQTDQYNGGDTSVGNDYTGYTPGYENLNIDTNYNDSNPDYGYNQGYDNTNITSPTWYTGDPNVMGGTGAPLSGGSTTNYGGDIKNVLSQLFTNGTTANMMGKGGAALLEGYQNQQKAAAAQKLAQSASLDPFGSQRSFYQQQAQNAVTNPYSSPIVSAQIQQIQNAQNIKDAAAGRRSNALTSAPAVLAAQAKIAQEYQNQMAQQGGSNISPSAGLSSILQSGSNSGINGYLSPLANLLGNTSQSNQNSNALAALKKFLSGE